MDGRSRACVNEVSSCAWVRVDRTSGGDDDEEERLKKKKNHDMYMKICSINDVRVCTIATPHADALNS